MTKNRALGGTKLSSITIVGLGEPVPDREMFELREHVAHMECRVEDAPPTWDHIPGESGDESE